MEYGIWNMEYGTWNMEQERFWIMKIIIFDRTKYIMYNQLYEVSNARTFKTKTCSYDFSQHSLI